MDCINKSGAKMLKIDPEKETKKITEFIRNTIKKEGFSNVVIGLSGGIDSTTSLYLLKEGLQVKNIIPVCLYYSPSLIKEFDEIVRLAKIPKENVYKLSIKESVDEIKKLLKIGAKSHLDRIRLGNIMARVRMIMLFDLAKKHKSLVCGTENRSEHYLGYFTRFGDEASDFEPIRHLYKTQVYKLAEYLRIPKNIIEKKPTAGLWPDQTDEKELGFSYQEADPVLFLYFEKKLTVDEIKKRGLKNADKIIGRVLKNKFKNETPYSL